MKIFRDSTYFSDSSSCSYENITSSYLKAFHCIEFFVIYKGIIFTEIMVNNCLLIIYPKAIIGKITTRKL